MTHAHARRIAIAAIEAEIKRLAVHANLHEQLGATYPAAVQASTHRAMLRAAIVKLSEPEQIKVML